MENKENPLPNEGNKDNEVKKEVKQEEPDNKNEE